MSYTPDSQHIDRRLDNLIDSIDDLCGAFQARIDDPDEWKAEHLQEIAEMSIELQQLRFKLRKFQAGK